MGSSKFLGNGPAQAPYRDEPLENDHAETASMASAVLLDNMESYPEDELPAYSDVPGEPSHIAVTPSRSTREVRNWYQ